MWTFKEAGEVRRATCGDGQSLKETSIESGFNIIFCEIEFHLGFNSKWMGSCRRERNCLL